MRFSLSEAQRAALKGRWLDLCGEAGVKSEDAEAWWSTVERRHDEAQRAYHTLAHLNEMFGYADSYRSQLTDHQAVGFAIYFHDIVYNPRAPAGKNEDDSAVIWEQFAQACLPVVDMSPGDRKGALITKVYAWIVQTKHHRCTEKDDADCKYFMDFDMAVLGRQWPEYEVYSEQIRIEFQHVPAAMLFKARGAFLKATAAGPSIYATTAFKDKFESQARKNMLHESELLQKLFAQRKPHERLVAFAALRLKAASKPCTTAASGACVVGAAAGAAAAPKVALSFCGLLLAGLGTLAAWLCCGAPYTRYPYPARAAVTSSGDVAIYAGSFNPPHFGHLEILRHLAGRFPKVVAVIGANPSKSYPVSPYVRQELLVRMLRDLGVENVEVAVVSGYVWRYAKEVGASVLFRGIRSWGLDGRDEKMLELLNIVGPTLLGRVRPLRTAYIQANPQYAHLSSTLVRKRLAAGGSISGFVPASSELDVAAAFGGSPG